MKITPPLRVGVLAALLFSTCTLAYAREVYSLDGEWKFAFGNGSAQTVSVPHTWNAKDAAAGPKSGKHSALSVQSKSYRRGKGVYTRDIPVPVKAGKRYFLRGEGASIVSEVFANGKSAGTHAGAFGAFCYEITNLLRAGEKNSLKITVDNSYNDDILPLSGDFSMFGGLYRSVSLIETDALCIDPAYFASPGVFIQQKNVSSNSAEISVSTMLNGAAGTPAELMVIIKDPTGKTVAQKKSSVKVPEKKEPIESTFRISRPKLWQGRENPNLYSVEVHMRAENGAKDSVVQPLGIRSVKISPDKGFILNGEGRTLRGVSRHQDMENKGWALSKADEERDIKLIAEVGADAIRTAHYPQTEHFYDLCDRYGFVVWTEVPAIEKVRSRPRFIENMKLQAKEMILQHGNHPSICVWGIFNEIFHQTTPEDRKVNMISILKDLNKYVHELDSSRPTVAATNQPGNRELNKIPDHLAANMYPGWYGGPPQNMGKMIDDYRKACQNQGFAISEYGHGADINTHEYPAKQPIPTSSHHPEEWQSYAHEINYREIKKRPQIWGTFIWNMFDFATAERKEGAKGGINDKGIVTYNRETRKDAFFFYKANWNPEPMLHITSKRFKNRPAGDVQVKVYANVKSVSLYVNGKKIGKTESPNEWKIIRWEKVELSPGENKIEVRASAPGGKKLTDSCTWVRK